MSTTAATGSSSNIIIRLQNLPNEARAIDIRRFFTGLSIPDGGVHVVGGEKGDAFIHFSSDDDARQAMVKSGNIYGNPIKLFLSSRSEMQTVINQARAAPTAKPPSATVEPSYSLDSGEQQEHNGAAASKLPSVNALSSMLAEFQAKANQQQMQQAAPMMDSATTNALILAAVQNGSAPLAIQQLLAALGEKPQSSLGQPFPFPMPNAMHAYPQPPSPANGWSTPQYVNPFQQQQQQQQRAVAALLYQQPSPFAQDRSNGSPVPSQFFHQTPITADEPYIRVRHIPIAYSYYNIKLLFSKYKLNLSDIKIIRDQNGQRTGEIVLRLHTNKEVADLLSQDGRIQCFHAMLDIKKIDEYTFASAVDSFLPGHVKKTPGAIVKNCIRVTGLPRKYERKDVKRFFTGCNVTNRPGGIFIETDTINGPTFVEFETEIDAEKAFFYNGEQMGPATIEMYRMTKADMENEINAVKRGPSDRPSRRPPLLLHEPSLGSVPSFHQQQLSNSPANPMGMHGPPANMNDDQARLPPRTTNIPYTTTDNQIHEFFGQLSIQLDNCKILLDRFNRGAGEALVRFRDPQSCQMAYDAKNRQIFYGRSLDLRPLSLFEYQNASITPMLTVNDLQSPSTINQHFQQANMKRVTPFYERVDDQRRNDKRPRWEAGNNFKEGYAYARNSPRVTKDEQVHELDEKDRRSSTPPMASATNLPPLPAELNDYLGRILVLSNVTYRATREEILEFLRPYAPIPETLKIRCDVNGKPTGFGVVACETNADATRAAAELNNQTFMLRKIFLQQR